MKNDEKLSKNEQDISGADDKQEIDSVMPDSPMLDEQWQSLTKDWQAQPFEKTDMNALVKKTKRRTYWAKSLLALDITATVLIFSIFIYGCFADKWEMSTQLFLFFSGIGSIIFVYYEFKIRLNTWQQNCGTPDKALEHAIASCQSSIKYIKLIKSWSWVMFPGMNCYLYIALQGTDKSLWSSFFFINIFMVATWLVTHAFHKKRIKELKELTKI